MGQASFRLLNRISLSMISFLLFEVGDCTLEVRSFLEIPYGRLSRLLSAKLEILFCLPSLLPGYGPHLGGSNFEEIRNLRWMQRRSVDRFVHAVGRFILKTYDQDFEFRFPIGVVGFAPTASAARGASKTPKRRTR